MSRMPWAETRAGRAIAETRASFMSVISKERKRCLVVEWEWTLERSPGRAMVEEREEDGEEL